MPHPTKYIIVTGEVVSSLGKGLTAASIGALLEDRGLAITLLAAGSASMSVILFIDARLVLSSLFLLATAPALAFAPGLRPLWLIIGLVGAYASLALVWRNTDRPD